MCVCSQREALVNVAKRFLGCLNPVLKRFSIWNSSIGMTCLNLNRYCGDASGAHMCKFSLMLSEEYEMYMYVGTCILVTWSLLP